MAAASELCQFLSLRDVRSIVTPALRSSCKLSYDVMPPGNEFTADPSTLGIPLNNPRKKICGPSMGIGTNARAFSLC